MPNLKEKSSQVLKSLLRFKTLKLMDYSKNEYAYKKYSKEIKMLEEEICRIKEELKRRNDYNV